MKINESVLKEFVGNLIIAHNLKLKGWISDVLQSDILEHKIYEFAVRQAMEYCYYEVNNIYKPGLLAPLRISHFLFLNNAKQVSKYDGREIAGHHFELEMISSNVVPQPPAGIVSRTNLKYIVDKLMTCEIIKFPHLFPDALKKKLLFNMLLVMMTTLTVFLGASECDILGHKIAAAFTTSGGSRSSVLKISPESSKIDPVRVNNFVEGLLRGEKTWLPLSIERAIITSVAVIVLTIFEEIFVDFRVNLIGATVLFHLVPGSKNERLYPVEEHRLRGCGLPSNKINTTKKIPSPVFAKWVEISERQYVEALIVKRAKILEEMKEVESLLRTRSASVSSLNDGGGVPVDTLKSGTTGRMSEAFETSKGKVNNFLKNSKLGNIPKTVKKSLAYMKTNKKSENKDNRINDTEKIIMQKYLPSTQ